MTAEVCSVMCGGSGFTAPGEFQYRWVDNRTNGLSPCQAYQKLLEASTTDVIIYAHDDVTIYDADWMERVMDAFSDSDVISVGLGGAVGLANRELYRRPFNINNMARVGYRSNQKDWEVHGQHLTGQEEVAVLDAFFMAFRRCWLDHIGGWPVDDLTHHCLDLWAACEAARSRDLGYKGKIVAVGVNCFHAGGGTSIKDTYQRAKWLQGGSTESDHMEPHKWLAREYIDVLPIEVK